MITYSQHKEDLWILDNLKPEKGVFCEVGAYDGIQSSNTLLFEQQGWNGLLIEPDPEMAWKCIQNRKMPVFCCAGGPVVGYGTFFVNEKDKGLSSLTTQTEKAIPVLVYPVGQLLAGAGFTQLDLLSLDTEGTEMDVWWGIRTMYKPRIVIVEHFTLPGPSKADIIVQTMGADDYQEVHRTDTNLIFVKK